MEQVLETKLDQASPYQSLCDLADVKPFHAPIEISSFTSTEALSKATFNERLTAALQVLIELSGETEGSEHKVDKVFLDNLIGKIDELIAKQLDEILHDKDFQELESLWRSIDYLVDKTDFRSNIKLELLDTTKQEIIEDFEDASETTQSALYKHVYIDEYDTPGGEPFTSMISSFDFNAGAVDLALLKDISKVASSAHCPFIANVGAAFFGKKNMDEVVKIEDLENYMEKAEYIKWNAFRQTEDARYIGLTTPQFLLRLPYGENNPVGSFLYSETVKGDAPTDYLWGKASFALAANMSKSFKENGWCVNIRGPEGGGRVDNLPLHQYNVGQGLQTKIPSEVLLSETKELAMAELGFIPLSYYKNSDFSCFFSVNSAQKPKTYDTFEATANAKINARLPYIFLSSRLAHYLKVMQRENIGSAKTRVELEQELNRWISGLVTKMNNPGKELAATHPLKEAKIEVISIPENPGFYRVSMHAMPHFQIEGMDVKLSLVAQLPTGDKK